ncbi:unnamed protein product [Amoebophrya sp. A25]|nr:unnamed protein product [Amoebophrya sp. A25]|eukprot:GSA25T00018983001.1
MIDLIISRQVENLRFHFHGPRRDRMTISATTNIFVFTSPVCREKARRDSADQGHLIINLSYSQSTSSHLLWVSSPNRLSCNLFTTPAWDRWRLRAENHANTSRHFTQYDSELGCSSMIWTD